MTPRRFAIAGLGCLLLAACGATRAPVVEELHPAPRAVAPAPVSAGFYQVKRGDTLYSIAFQYGYSYQQIAAWNHIAEPYVIYVDQRLRVIPPGATAPSPARVPPAQVAPVAGILPATRPAASASTPSSDVSALPNDSVPSGPLRWTWPTEGRVLHAFNPDEPNRKGIDIRGRLGQKVAAAAQGRVVYSGSGLIGYGQLVIVKHDKNILSAYGHNGRLLVKEGDTVRSGQAIAEMGTNGAEGPMLHFEIRRDGNPVNPAPYLPRR